MAQDELGQTVPNDHRDQQPAQRQRHTSSELRGKDIGEKITSIGLPDLIVPVIKHHRQLIVDLSILNRMRIASLQKELVTEVRRIDVGGELAPDNVLEIDSLLSRYCKAIQDWELMMKYSAHANGKHEKDPFMITTNSYLQREILNDANLLHLNRRTYRIKDSEEHQLPIGSRPGLRMLQNTQEFMKRFLFAIFGGLSLLAPMILMVLHKDTLTALLTVSVSVLLFAFVIALLADDVSPSIVVASVAAYSAVLVVFVGASSGGG